MNTLPMYVAVVVVLPKTNENHIGNKLYQWGAAIAQWIHLHLPFCRPRLESQGHQLHFYHL